MTASMLDKITKVGNPGTLTTLQPPGKDVGAASILLTSPVNFPTETAVIFSMQLFDIGKGLAIEGSYTVWKGILSGSSIDSLELLYGSDQQYPAGDGAQVFIYVSTSWANSLVDGILTSLKPNGKLKTGAVDVADVLAADVVETAKIKNLNITTAKYADASVTKAKLEKPHYNKLIWSTDGTGSGQVVGTQSAANFDASDTANAVGITATTGTGAYLTILRDGLYNLAVQTTMVDSSGAFPKTAIVWYKFSFDNGATSFSLRATERPYAGNDGTTQQYNLQTWLPAGTRIGLEWYANPAAIRWGAPAASGTLTSYLARTVFGSYLSVAEIR